MRFRLFLIAVLRCLPLLSHVLGPTKNSFRAEAEGRGWLWMVGYSSLSPFLSFCLSISHEKKIKTQNILMNNKKDNCNYSRTSSSTYTKVTPTKTKNVA